MRRTAFVVDGDSMRSVAAVRSLGRAGWRVLAPAGTRAGASRYAEAVAVAAAEDDPGAFVVGVAAAVGREGVVLLVPTTDASLELLWREHEALGSLPILGADRRSFELSTDKAACLAAADAARFPTPRWLAPRDVDDARAFVASTGLPAVVKPRRSYTVRDGRLEHRRHTIVRRLDALEPALRRLAQADGTLPVVQEYVPGRSLAVSAIVHAGEIVARIAREALSYFPVAGGAPVWKRTISPSSVGVQETLDLLRAIGYEGLVNVEYQVGADGGPRSMEFSGRIHASIPLAMAAGLDLPLLAARVAVGEEVGPVGDYRLGLEMRSLPDEVARARQAIRADAIPPEMTRWSALARAWPPWRPGMQYDGFELDDVGPLLPSWLRRDHVAVAVPA